MVKKTERSQAIAQLQGAEEHVHRIRASLARAQDAEQAARDAASRLTVKEKEAGDVLEGARQRVAAAFGL